MADTEREFAKAASFLKQARRVAVLTGAGVSAESGVPTFRAADGLWEGHRIEDVATPQGFARNPDLVWRFYNERRANVAKVAPNPGHEALVKLEQRSGEFTLITQNVDGLHLVAGSKNVLEIHGSLRQTRCLGCAEVVDRGLAELGPKPLCPSCGARLRPHIVWFGEGLPEDVWQASFRAAAACDVFLVVGTSAVVHPAASLIPIARGEAGFDRVLAIVIECNLTRTEASSYADVTLLGPSGVTLPRLLELVEQPI